MKKTAILYWAKGGSVEKTATTLLNMIGADKADLFDICSFDPKKIDAYANYIFGSATVGADIWLEASDGNKWNDFFVKLEGKNLSDKKIAAFGLGNQVLYPDHFVNSLGYMKEEVEKLGGRLIGAWPVSGYEFNDSEGLANDTFFGLAIDEDIQPELSEARVRQWIELLDAEMKF